MTKFRLAWLAMLWWLYPIGNAHAETVTGKAGVADRELAVSVWYPDGISVIRGVLVFTGGQGAGGSNDTRPAIEDEFHRRFAESLGFALLGNQFTGPYTDAANGPGQALLDALADVAAKSGHSELAHAPLLLHGFSNGGYFSYTFAQWAPQRVIAFCLNKSGFARAPLTAAFLAVPGVFFWGGNEPGDNVPTVVRSLVREGRKQHALWAELKEWGKGHADGEVERVSLPFFAEMVSARYPKGNKTPLTGEVPLVALDEAAGWLGDASDASIERELPGISKFAAYGGDKTAASWLPSEGIANLWRGFVTKQPFALEAPGSGTSFDARETLQLRAAGLASGARVSFLDGARQLASALAADSGEAKAGWTPEWGGARGLVAVAKIKGQLTRTSRPAAIVLHGKPPPPPAAKKRSAARACLRGPGRC
ncbi:MAG TPA: hypothetical protein VJV78_05070 [Polyangiales bacterium]|nr:hypothetical protein [Polyangiales bacterium]